MAKTPPLIGPFPASVKPARPGLYKRKTIKSGKLAFAYFDGKRWYTYSTERRNAIRKAKRGCVSKNSLCWYGSAKRYKFADIYVELPIPRPR